jgi:hypothetical protein
MRYADPSEPETICELRGARRVVVSRMNEAAIFMMNT